MKNQRSNKRKQPSIAIDLTAYNGDENSHCLSSTMGSSNISPHLSLTNCCVPSGGGGREVTRVSKSHPITSIKLSGVTRVSKSPLVPPIKFSGNDHQVAEKSTKKQVKFRPKVMASSPITPSPVSRSGRRGNSSSCKRALDFDLNYIHTKLMRVYTKSGFCSTRRVNKCIQADQQKSLECFEKEEVEWWKNEQKLFQQRALSFISSMRPVQGYRSFMGWKGSVVDSVVGVFLAQNAADSSSSSAFMSLAAKYPKSYTTRDPKTENRTEHALDWNAVRSSQLDEISLAIKERGMNIRIAARILKFLDRIHDDKSGLLDLEWLRNSKPADAMDFLKGIYGLGVKSMECLRLLTLRQRAFPVDRHVSRIVTRLGWVPTEKLPDGVLIHELEEYPEMKHVQEYLSLRLSNLDAETLYELHYHMITFGKVFCTKKKPNCNSCPLKKDCMHFTSTTSSSRCNGPQDENFVPDTPPGGSTGPATPVLSSPSRESSIKLQLVEDIEDLCLGPKVHPVILKKNASRLRTEHQVYELPDSHLLMQAFEKRDADDKKPYLLAIWPPGKTQNPSVLLNEECNSLKSADSQEEETVSGTILVPCRAATRGSFPLDGTFFQINEVFADHESSEKPLVVPRTLLLGLTTKTLYCGTSISAIFEGMSTKEIQECFRKGYVCIRGFSMRTRAPRPLHQQFHLAFNKKTVKSSRKEKSPRKKSRK